MNPLGLEDAQAVISSTGRSIHQQTKVDICDPEIAA